MADFRGEDVEPEPEMRIELPVDANLPGDYVESERLRLEMYKRLAEVRSEDDIAEVRAELEDRYGPLPEPTEQLLQVARFRLLCRSAGVTEVVAQGNNIRFSPAVLPDSRQMRLARLHPGSVIKHQAGFILVPRPTTAPVLGQPLTGDDLLEWATRVVNDILAPVPVPTPAR